MPEGISETLEEAFAAAETELPLAEGGDPAEALPPEREEEEAAAEQATSEVSDEQPSAGNEVDDLLSELPTEPLAADPASPEFWEQQVMVEIDGSSQTVSLEEMRSGYLRQSDYTRKTQEVARERGLVREAVDFHQAFKEDPQGFASYLAEKAGFIEPGTAPQKDVILYTKADLEAQVEEGVAKALEDHPDIKAARETQGALAVEAVFANIEEEYGPLSRENKVAILQEAKRRDTTDVRLVFESMLVRAQRLKQAQAAAQKSSTAAPSTPPTAEDEVEMSIEDLEDAFVIAEKELLGSAA